MNERIEVPIANLSNIAIFPEYPGQDVLEEIRQHIRDTSCPHTWRGHSHTKPPPGGTPPQYCDEYDVPAPDRVAKIAPCPCCNPFHRQYKKKGKVAWFPDESVIRLIGPVCYAKINPTGHESALIDLRRNLLVREQLATIKLHAPHIENLIAVIDSLSPIASALDALKTNLHQALENDLALFWSRTVRGGVLTTEESRQVSIQKSDGTYGSKRETTIVTFATISGHAMIDHSGQISAGKKLLALRSGLTTIAKRLQDVGDLTELSEAERRTFHENLPAARKQVSAVLEDARRRQLFLTSDALDTLARWGKHQNQPRPFNIQRKTGVIVLTSGGQKQPPPVIVDIPSNASNALPDLPVIGEM
ncbi:hypothetical protein J5289_03595 [Rhizobium sp. B230/85]|uniref:hypothetical protein n=1 Tax=unclassified Rhizobium TaxID=2613769 RepID=UPI001ADAD690|nr:MULTISPECIES: hypothetical protein [unclassified Rhizobium]MBO9134193.1 hypothetical protein [Rhizobium sp. B209b/85]QXZ96679.1 hypothetical protein J5289_03595 [Rhizobium sp. B230/85]